MSTAKFSKRSHGRRLITLYKPLRPIRLLTLIISPLRQLRQQVVTAGGKLFPLCRLRPLSPPSIAGTPRYTTAKLTTTPNLSFMEIVIFEKLTGKGRGAGRDQSKGRGPSRRLSSRAQECFVHGLPLVIEVHLT